MTDLSNDEPVVGVYEPITNSGSRAPQYGLRQLFMYLRNFHLIVTVEPVVFGLFLAYSASDVISMNMYITRTCLTVFNYSYADCEGTLKPEVNDVVNPYVVHIIMIKVIIESGVSAFVTFFVGPWSDKYGRKLFILLPVVGSALGNVLWIVFLFTPNVHPIFFILTSVPSSLVGGMMSLFACAYCYIADITTEVNRPLRMIIVSLALSLGTLSGYSLTNPVMRMFENTYNLALFTFAAVVLFIVSLYIHFGVSESVCFLQEDRDPFLSFKQVKHSFKVIVKKRPGGGNFVIFFLAGVISIYLFVLEGEASYKFIISKEVFSWTLEDYNTYSAVLCLSSILISVPFVYVTSNLLKLNELFMAIILSLVAIYSSTATSFCKTTLDFYLVSVLGVFTGIIVQFVKADIFKNILKEERGTLLAAIAMVETVAPMLSSPLYAYWYNIVFKHKKSMDLYLLSAFFWTLAFCFLITAFFIKTFCRRTRHSEGSVEESHGE